MPKLIKYENEYVMQPDNVVKIPYHEPDEQDEAKAPVEEIEEVVEVAPAEPEMPENPIEQTILQNAKSGAEEVSRRIMQIARIEREKILEQAHVEAEKIRRDAFEEATAQAAERYEKNVLECIRQVDEALDELAAGQQEFFEQYERELKYLALDIANKVLHTTLSENGSALLELVKDAVSSVKSADWISVEVSNRLVVLVHQLRKDYSGDNAKNVDILPRNIPEDQCVVRTSEGTIDISVPTQIDNLRKMFEQIDER